VFWPNPQQQSPCGTSFVNYLLVVGTKSTHHLTAKLAVHKLGIKTALCAQRFTQLFNIQSNSILATIKELWNLSSVSTDSTTSTTSLANASIIKTTGCGRMEYL
jgi:hypothetical protein